MYAMADEGSSAREVDRLMDTDNSTQIDDELPDVATMHIKLYMWPVLLVVGALGNSISLIALRKLSGDVLSTCLYLAVQCAADTIVLFTRCGNDWIRIVTEHVVDVSGELMSRSEVMCKSLPFVCGSINHMSRWLVTAASIEGFIASKYPQSVPARFTVQHAQAVIMLLSSLVVCVNMHYFWSFELVSIVEPDRSRSTYCTFAKDEYHRQSVYFQETVWPLLDNAVANVFPLALIVICTVATTINIATGRHRGSTACRVWRERYTIEPYGVEQLVWLPLASGVAFTCFLLPKVTVEIICKYFNVDESEMAWIGDINEMAEYMWLSTKIIVYLVVSERFRREIIRVCFDRPARNSSNIEHVGMMETYQVKRTCV